MKKIFLSVLTAITVIGSFAQIDSTALNNVFGKKGLVQGNVYKITFPRSDLKVKVGDFSVAPGLALGSWVGILQMGNESMMMGDLVLLDSEVSKVIAKLVEENLDITAIHNHLINETPNIKYIHFHGSGGAAQLAEKIKAVLEVTATPLTAPVAQTQPKNIDWSKVTSILVSCQRIIVALNT